MKNFGEVEIIPLAKKQFMDIRHPPLSIKIKNVWLFLTNIILIKKALLIRWQERNLMLLYILAIITFANVLSYLISWGKN